MTQAPATHHTDRIFFALVPDATTAGRIAALAQQLRRQHGLKGRPLPPERLHLTLQFLGDHAGRPDALIASACAAASTLRVAAFELAFDRVACFERRSRRPVVLRGGDALAPVQALHAALGAALIDAGVPIADRRPYTPHLTLLYDDRGLPALPIAPIGWTARELVLFDSLIGQRRHLVVQRWPLI